MISDVEVPSSEPKLVVTGFLSPGDDTISITVRKSRPLYVPYQSWENTFPAVNNATVTLSDGTNSINLSFNSLTGSYIAPSSTMPIEAGKKYFLQVTTPDGYSVTSDCTVPSGNTPEVEITGIDSIEQYGSESKKVSFRFRDLPGKGQFYRVAAGTFFGDETSFYSYFYETGFERGEPYVSDKNKDEEYFLFRTNEISNSNSSSNDTLYVSLQLTDENYYNYHRSINSFGGDNPFAEPTPVFSNIKGGLGVFSAVYGRITKFPLNNL